jgi:hypothetical protein
LDLSQGHLQCTLDHKTLGQLHQKACATATGFHNVLEMLTLDLPLVTALLDGLLVHSQDQMYHLQHIKALHQQLCAHWLKTHPVSIQPLQNSAHRVHGALPCSLQYTTWTSTCPSSLLSHPTLLPGRSSTSAGPMHSLPQPILITGSYLFTTELLMDRHPLRRRRTPSGSPPSLVGTPRTAKRQCQPAPTWCLLAIPPDDPNSPKPRSGTPELHSRNHTGWRPRDAAPPGLHQLEAQLGGKKNSLTKFKKWNCVGGG